MQVHDTWAMPRQPIWIHKNQQFIKGVIKQIYKDIITCMLQNGDTLKVKRSDIYHRNPLPIEATRTDLMQNDIINQPQILQHLASRFQNRKIYTFVQNTVIAVNPYTPIPELYTDELRDQYIQKIINCSTNMKDCEPHLYSITAQMVQSLFEDQCDQAIIISGESGAGKTQVNKQCLRFLARYFRKLSSNQNSQNSNIEKAIMLSNPILQAFGNSKTIRNNNSSRFGKYLSIMIDPSTKAIKHAQIFNYLLQKSRIISRAKQQQNFHIFYQFLQKTTKNEKVKYFLINHESKQMSFQDFNYTKNDSQTEYSAHPDISFQKIKQSLIILPDKKSYDYLCRILSAILHLGNLEPQQDQSSDNCQILPVDTFQTICYLLEVEKKYLYESLTSYSVKIGGEDMVKSFSKRQVQQLIHSLSKILYERLFEWIINSINSSTKSHDHDQKTLISLGFLDIYGFQVLKSNSLQQLFINYTNQRLHQLYLQKIFKLQKQNFINEKLQHKFREVDFQDNLKVIELIDYDNLSIFNLLDEWCSVASPDETTFITKIRFNHKKHEKFPLANLNLLSTQFIIRHTPQDIQYSVVGFREKNKDLLRQQIKITMRSSKLKILNEMFTEPKNENEMDSKNHRVRKFLSSKFRKQMNQLVNGLLSKTQQHFIRCIKSNGNKKPLQIDQQIVYSQIKYLGILDTIKIKKMGYCIKVKYEEIDKRFPWLVRSQFAQHASQEDSVSALRAFLPKFGEEEILFGDSKVFFRDYSYTILMKKYAKYIEDLNKKAHLITCIFIKMKYIRKRNLKLKNYKIINSYFKSFLQTKKLVNKIRDVKKVQKTIISYLAYRSRAKKLQSVQILQAYIKRNIEAKNKAKKMHMIQKVILRFKFLILRKKVRSRLIANYIMQNVLIDKLWKDLRKKNSQILCAYINALKIKITKRQKIHQALTNERNAIQGRSLQRIESYLLGYASSIGLRRKINQIKILQSNFRSFVAARKYKRLLDKIVLVQKAVRQYLFLKKGAKGMFQKTYSHYQLQIINQNKLIENRLYDSQLEHASDLNSCIRKFLGKFKQKISLLYFIIDFEAYINLEIVYPEQSWMTNYVQKFEEGLDKNDPLQYLSVGETFTVAATTTKMYLWGMHDSCRNIEPGSVSLIKTKMPVQFFQITKNKLHFSYIKQDQIDKKIENKQLKINSTVAKDFYVESGKLFQCLAGEMKLIKQIPSSQRILQISCGKAHTILRSSSKKIYTFGYGRQGQLGHTSFNSEQKPRSIKFFQNMKTFYPIQVAASFTSSLVLLSNRKMYWFGKNGTISQISTPTLFQLKSKCQIMNSSEFSVARILPSWSRTMSVIGLSVICYNGKFENNLSLRNKTTQLLISKWQQAGIYNINPPIIASVSDNLQQCHVKLKKKKISIQPESKQVLKQMQQKVKSIASLSSVAGLARNNTNNQNQNQNSVGTQFSFANTQHNSIIR